jgi:hypothetical protein
MCHAIQFSKSRGKKRMPLHPMRECAQSVRKWDPDHKRFWEVSGCAAVSKKNLQNFYFWSKHHAHAVRCGEELSGISGILLAYFFSPRYNNFTILYEAVMKKSTVFALSALAVALLFSSIAFADAGTPLMWLEFGHLAILNLFIGILEGLIIWIIFRTGIFRTIGILIVANYFSAFAGYVGLLRLIGKIEHKILADAPLYNALTFIVIMGIAAFVLSVILEWPFCLWALRKKTHRVFKSLVAVSVVNIVSYAILVWLYVNVSTLSVYRNVSIDHNLTLPDTQNYWIYYISTDNGNIYRIHPDGSAKSKVFDANLIIEQQSYFAGPRLFVLPSTNKHGYDLWATEIPPKGNETLLIKNFTTNAVLAQEHCYQAGEIIDEPNKLSGSYSFQFTASDFRDPNARAWIAWNNDWAWRGLIVENKITKQKFTVGLETPFLLWMVRSPIILPGDFVIFQLGDQIVLLDINNRKIRLITLGRGPVVTMD